MVQFMTSYFNSMDREFTENSVKPMEDLTADSDQSMIIPISKIGTTFADSGGGNILQNLERMINVGAGKVQLVFTQGVQGSAVRGGGPSAFGKQVRQALKEKVKASGADWVGVELSPAHLNGLAGFDGERGTINEQKRQGDLMKVKEAIRFAADVGGGGVDLWSQEFSRSVIDADWNYDPKDKDKPVSERKKLFYGHSPEELKDVTKARVLKYLIDSRTGNPISESQVLTDSKLFLPVYRTAKDMDLKKDKNGRSLRDDDCIDFDGLYVDKNDPQAFERLVPLLDNNGRLKVASMNWNDVIKHTEEYNKEAKTSGDKALTPEEWFYRQKQIGELAQARGQVAYYGHGLKSMYGRLEDLQKQRDFIKDFEEKMSKEAQQDWIEKNVGIGGGTPSSLRNELLNMKPSDAVNYIIEQEKEQLRGHRELAMSAQVRFDEMQDRIEHITTPQKFAFEKSVDSYSDLGIDAMKVTKDRNDKAKKDGVTEIKPLYVGPELGWAGDGFGGHPEEFGKLIEESRKKMAEKLVNEGYAESEAKDKAKAHIKGMLDTSHLAMWYKHFRRKDDQSEDDHLKEFNKWMKDEVKKLVEKGVVGGVQVVDTMTGEHAHLPAGQGQFEVAELVKDMVKNGFKGDIISEGHDEDTIGFGQGRILTEAWQAFGANVGNVMPGQKMGVRSWGGMHHSYFGHTNPTNYIIGAYVPSNDFAPWSDIGFE